MVLVVLPILSCPVQPLESLTPLLVQPGLTGKQPLQQEILQKVSKMAGQTRASHSAY